MSYIGMKRKGFHGVVAHSPFPPSGFWLYVVHFYVASVKVIKLLACISFHEVPPLGRTQMVRWQVGYPWNPYMCN